MANIFVRGATGVNTNTGADWNNAKQTVAGALAIAVSNDRILVDKDEQFTANAAITWTPPAGNVSILSVLRSGTTGFSKFIGARESVGGVLGAFTIAGAAGSSMYVWGMQVFAGTTNTSSNNLNLLTTVSVSATLYLDSCTLTLSTIAAAASLICGPTGQAASRSNSITLRNSSFVYGSRAGSAITLGDITLEFINQGLVFGATKPAQLFTVGSIADTPIVLVRDCDWSGAFANPLVLMTNLSSGAILFKNSKFGSSTVTVSSFAFGAWSLLLRNCIMPGYTALLDNYNFSGYHTVNTGMYLTNSDAAAYAGASACWEVVTFAGATEFTPFITQILEVWNDVTGTRTATVEICSTVSGPYTDRDIWMEATYDSSILAGVSNRNADPFVGTGANHPTSTVPWAATTVSKQQLQVTFTASVVGPLQVRIYIGLPSFVSFFINPVIKLT